jgi:hypothetical protein
MTFRRRGSRDYSASVYVVRRDLPCAGLHPARGIATRSYEKKRVRIVESKQTLQRTNIEGNSGWLIRHIILCPQTYQSWQHSTKYSILHHCQSINIHSLVKAHVPKCLPILRQPIMADQDKLTRHVIVYPSQSVVKFKAHFA